MRGEEGGHKDIRRVEVKRLMRIMREKIRR